MNATPATPTTPTIATGPTTPTTPDTAQRLDRAVLIALCVLARALGYPWSDTVDLDAAASFALSCTTVERLSFGGAPTESFRVTVRHGGREWVRCDHNILVMIAQIARVAGSDLGTMPPLDGAPAEVSPC
jgi:hypothetical protein